MKSTSAAPERILAFGLYGSGKTHSWATIASYYRRMETPGHFYVISCEHDTVARLADGYPTTDSDPGFHTNVEYTDVHNWGELVTVTDHYLGRVEPGDWLVIEGIDKPWQFIQALWHNTKGAIGDPTDPFAMMQTEIDPKSGQPEVDWVRVNAVYRNWLVPILTSKAHVWACAPSEAVRVPTGKAKEWADSKETVDLFGRFGVKPDGQKHLGFQFHTVLLMSNPRHGEYRVTSVDDHTRVLLEDAPIEDFVIQYLVAVARWEI